MRLGNNTGSPEVSVAVVDTGVDLSHPDLSGKVVAGYNFITTSSPPQDDNSHGTHVAGIIGAETDNSIGVAGTDWNVKIMPLKVLDSEGYGYIETVAEAISSASSRGFSIINCSLETPYYNRTLWEAVFNAWRNGVIIVAASGNREIGEEYDDIVYPAGFPYVIGVGASDYNNQRASYSQYGFAQDLMAPAGAIPIIPSVAPSGPPPTIILWEPLWPLPMFRLPLL